MKSRKNILKNAGVLLIVAVMVLSTFVVTAMNNRTVTLYEGFEDGVMPPAGWSVFDYGEEGWGITSDSFSGENAAWWMGSVASDLISYTVDCSAMSEAYLSFWHKQPSSARGQDTLSVYISEDGGAWGIVADYSDNITGYTHEMIDLTGYISVTLQVKFTATGGGGGGVYLDEIRLCDGYATEFMGIDIAPLGIAELEIIGDELRVYNIGSSGDDGVYIDVSGKYNHVKIDMKEDPSIPVGTSIKTEVIMEDPDYSYTTLDEKVSDYEWNMSIKCETSFYVLIAFLDDEIVYYKEIDSIRDSWFSLGAFDSSPAIKGGLTPDTGPYGMSISNMEDADGSCCVKCMWPKSDPPWWKFWDDDWPLQGLEEKVDHLTINREKTSENISDIVGIKITASFPTTGEFTITALNGEKLVDYCPAEPNIDGPTSGKPGTEYTYVITNTGVEDVYFIVEDWGDGSKIELTLLTTPPGGTATVKHTWYTQGTYTIKVRAMNEWHVKGFCTELSVTMPRNKIVNRPFLQFLESHPKMFPILQLLLQRLGL